MRKSRANVAEMIEPLESRTCLSGLIAYLDFFTGALVHGHFPHTVAAMTLAITDQRRNILDGEIYLHLSKHDDLTYDFTTEIIHHKLHLNFSSQDSYLNGDVTMEVVLGLQRPESIIGNGEFAGHAGAFVLNNIPSDIN
jgi:hypothetical protein